MKVVVRADASPTVGSGHIMRCLALADELAARGCKVLFVTRVLPPHLATLLARHGHAHAVVQLDPPAGAEAPQAAWAAAHQQQDARATEALLASDKPDWLVLDHYGLDAQWETELRSTAGRLLAIDDLARAHVCDVLLDANCRADARTTYARAAPGAKLLLGPRYALLRPEFAHARRQVAVRTGPVRRLLVFLGGMDADNATGRVLQAIERLRQPPPELDVVIGATHPALHEIQAFCAAGAGRRCHVQTSDMAGLLSAADAAVGAGGGASWERCCLGVPSLALALAENQSVVLAEAAAAGLLLLPDSGLPEPALLSSHLEALLDNKFLRQRLSAAGMAAVDGRGAARVAIAMMDTTSIAMRLAGPQDCEHIYAWRNAPEIRAASRDSSEMSLADHRRWFDTVLASSHRVLLVGEDQQGPVGVVRFDLSGTEAEVSIYLAAGRHGQGVGRALLRGAEDWLATHRPSVALLNAEVLAGNTPSQLLFEEAGYLPASKRYRKGIANP